MQVSKKPSPSLDALSSQVERILESNTFRNSDALKRLFRFLADKTIAGEAEGLKEYSLGLDVIGKPPSYDPRSDSTVRIQVGRLRQKLIQYYRTEGTDDKWIVDLPKGQFGLTCESSVTLVPEVKTEPPPQPPQPLIVPDEPQPPKRVLPLVKFLVVALAISAIVSLYLGVRLATVSVDSAAVQASWSSDLNELWKAFVDAKRPLLVSVLDHPMVSVKGFGAYTDLRINNLDELVDSPTVIDLRKRYNDQTLQTLFYTSRGDVDIYFHLGRLLGQRVPVVSLLRTRDLSWQQLSDNNVIFIGSQEYFEERLRGLPLALDFAFDRRGFTNLRPLGAEPKLFVDRPPTESGENGEGYALITNVPGPREVGTIRSFSANRSAPRVAAVKAFAEEQTARMLVSKLRKPSGELPPYWQMILGVKYKGSVPTEIAYITHHELTAQAHAH